MKNSVDGLDEIASKAPDSPMPRPMKENGTSSRISSKEIESAHLFYAEIAQLVECLFRNQKVASSNLAFGSSVVSNYLL